MTMAFLCFRAGKEIFCFFLTSAKSSLVDRPGTCLSYWFLMTSDDNELRIERENVLILDTWSVSKRSHSQNACSSYFQGIKSNDRHGLPLLISMKVKNVKSANTPGHDSLSRSTYFRLTVQYFTTAFEFAPQWGIGNSKFHSCLVRFLLFPGLFLTLLSGK